MVYVINWPASFTPSLTFQSLNERLSVFNQLLDELVGFVQLQLVRFEPLPELRAVQVAVTELQSR